MSECKNCNKEITLKDNETKCPSCGTEQTFNCWNCSMTITPGKNKECPVCFWFICEQCDSCIDECKFELQWIKINEYIEPKDNIRARSHLRDIVAELIHKKKPMRICERGVPWTYAKNIVPKLIRKIDGIQTKKIGDQQRFEERLANIKSMDDLKEFTVESEREIGFNGNEQRETIYLAACTGLAKLKWEENKNKGKVIGTRDAQAKVCPFFQGFGDIHRRQCPKCKHLYLSTIFECEVCVYQKNTEKNKKGDRIQTRAIKSSVDICSFENEKFVNTEIYNG